MHEALGEAKAGLADGESPIGCVIALMEPGGPRIVARGHNRVGALGRMTAHAEMVAFEAGGGSKDRSPALPPEAKNVLLVSTLEPCVMCLGACMETGVAAILWGLQAPADSGTGRVRPPSGPDSSSPVLEGGLLAGESRALFEEFLRRYPDRPQGVFIRQLLALT